eukprot:8601242-Ditylum_brightwellii.AAC.1
MSTKTKEVILFCLQVHHPQKGMFASPLSLMLMMYATLFPQLVHSLLSKPLCLIELGPVLDFFTKFHQGKVTAVLFSEKEDRYADRSSNVYKYFSAHDKADGWCDNEMSNTKNLT